MRKSRPSIQILLAVSQTIIREALRYLLEQQPDMQIVGETGEGGRLPGLLPTPGPRSQSSICECRAFPGLEILGRLRGAASKVRVLVLATAEDKDRIVQAFRLGARGVALRESTMNVLPTGIRSVADGKYWIAGDTVSNPVKGLRSFGARSKAGAPKEGFRPDQARTRNHLRNRIRSLQHRDLRQVLHKSEYGQAPRDQHIRQGRSLQSPGAGPLRHPSQPGRQSLKQVTWEAAGMSRAGCEEFRLPWSRVRSAQECRAGTQRARGTP